MAPDIAEIGHFQHFSGDLPHVPPCKIAINGFGRIGRNVLRASLLREDVEVVAINHTCVSVDDVIYLIEHDSTHGPLTSVKHSGPPFHVSALPNGDISINGRRVALLSQRDVRQINWGLYGAETVAECTGKFTKTALAKDHIEHGAAKKVIISAPSADAPAFVFKVVLCLATSSQQPPEQPKPSRMYFQHYQGN
ncbi:hypothetical protein H2199_002473 [Coniosporium tulheliwenetii]|uniref:Uncharacterized protein n=1 Tax=Coniosporium tulheliwenetii TaxID=3383036 RepID=A0ACC2ZF03_9PEZI|nr:hypothetical protein H2199_002473 [Cladosporium sp. JES 115]